MPVTYDGVRRSIRDMPHPDAPPCAVKGCERLTEKVFSYGTPSYQFPVCEFHHVVLPGSAFHLEGRTIVLDVGAPPDLIGWEFTIRAGSAGTTVVFQVRDKNGVDEALRFRASREQLKELAWLGT